MSPLERLEWLTKLARSNSTYGMMAVAADVAYRAGDNGAYGLPDGGLKPAGARKARAALLKHGWLVRTKAAWFPAVGEPIATVVAKRSHGSATVVAVTDPMGAHTATVVAKTATVGSHNGVDINGTTNRTGSDSSGDAPQAPPPKPKHMLKFEAQYQTPQPEVVAIPFEETPQGKACAENRARIRAMRLAKEQQSA